MPLYEYECRQCGEHFERRQSVHEAPVQDCPDCGGTVRRVIFPVGIIFKGSGFYVTDSRRPQPIGDGNGSKATEKENGSASANGSAGTNGSAKSEKSEKSETSKAAESTPAASAAPAASTSK